MYFYHEDYCGAYDTELEDLGSRDRRDIGRRYEPIPIPAILNWVIVMGVALCVIALAIQALS